MCNRISLLGFAHRVLSSDYLVVRIYISLVSELLAVLSWLFKFFLKGNNLHDNQSALIYDVIKSL